VDGKVKPITRPGGYEGRRENTMAKVVKVWKGTGYDKEVRLKKYIYADGSMHYEFRNRFDKQIDRF